jgi:glycosyltransferase involved in cell wall biosynthesis
MMKILILTPKVPFPPKDGGAIATLSLAEGLADTENEVEMLCLNTTKHPFDVEQIHGYLKKKINFHAVNHDTRIRPLKAFFNLFFSCEPYNATRFYSTKFRKKLVEILHKFKPDVVQLEGPYMGYYIQTIKQHSVATVSLRAHNVENEIWQRKAMNTLNPFQKFYFVLLSSRIKQLEKKVLEKTDLMVAISERDRNQLRQLFEVKSITVPTGLNSYRYPTPKNPRFPSLFFIGALDWMPNQEGLTWFIESVFLRLIQKQPEIQFHIAGRNAPVWLEEKLKEYSDRGIIYHGEVENAYEYMNRYAIFISPLLTGSGIRIKILEGMMMQRAIVATSLAAEGIPVSDRKNILIADSPGEMLDTLLELTKNREKYNAIAKNSREFVIENFNNLATSKRLCEFYRSNLT